MRWRATLPVLFGDEPLSNLDAAARRDARQIKQLHQRTHCTSAPPLPYVTHDQVEATLGDRPWHRGDEGRPGAAVRQPAGRDLRQAGQPLRRRVHRLAGDEHGRRQLPRRRGGGARVELRLTARQRAALSVRGDGELVYGLPPLRTSSWPTPACRANSYQIEPTGPRPTPRWTPDRRADRAHPGLLAAQVGDRVCLRWSPGTPTCSTAPAATASPAAEEIAMHSASLPLRHHGLSPLRPQRPAAAGDLAWPVAIIRRRHAFEAQQHAAHQPSTSASRTSTSPTTTAAHGSAETHFGEHLWRGLPGPTATTPIIDQGRMGHVAKPPQPGGGSQVCAGQSGPASSAWG